jgi:hypothetical protein
MVEFNGVVLADLVMSDLVMADFFASIFLHFFRSSASLWPGVFTGHIDR